MTSNTPKVSLVGDVAGQLWGLDLRDYQSRAWIKVGADGLSEQGNLLVGTDWILSPALQSGLLARPGTALIVPDAATGQDRVAAIHLDAEMGDQRGELADCVSKPCDEARLKAAGLEIVSMEALAGDYDAALRKSEPPYALSILTTAPRHIERRQFRGAYKGVTDLVTKYAWPRPAFHATRWAAAAGITPNTVTTVSLVLVVVAFWFFWQGAWPAGIVAAWGMTFLDTVDGKLARTTMTYSKWGNHYDHGIDLIHPPFWYWAIYQGLVSRGSAIDQATLLAALVIILAGYVLNRLEEAIFVARYGFHIHVWRRIDSLARIITARRNPNLLIFMLAVLIGFPGAGFLAVAVWTVIWLVFHGVRLVQAMASRQPVTPWLARA